jgi:abortive infection alpha-like protein
MTVEREELPPVRRRDELVDSLPGLARIYGSAWYHTAGWAAETSAKAGARVLRAAISREPPREIIGEMTEEVRRYARRFLGIVDAEGNRVPDAVSDFVAARARPEKRDGAASLLERGEELLRRSADVDYEEGAHPAYGRILTELAPDEGRILRLLIQGGPQPAVDVRTVGLVVVGSELVGAGFNMIGAEAGCRHVERVPAYLNNLNRLGLIWFSREPVADSMRYQVLEAQPEVLRSMRAAGRAKTVRRSIGLTPFGEDFCRVCLPVGTAELDALPAKTSGI